MNDGWARKDRVRRVRGRVVATAVVTAATLLSPAVAGAAPEGPRPWTVQPTPRPGPSNSLASVSCSGPTSCFAVGVITSRTHDTPLIEHFDGTAWSVTPSRKAGISSGLTGVSCAGPSFCVAVGYTYDGDNTQTLVETWRGTRWSVTPSANEGTKGDWLTSVSCVSKSSCVAVGRYDSPVEFDQTLAEAWNGSAWAVTASPNPGAMDNTLRAVSCTSATECFAVGNQGNPGDLGSTVLTEHWHGGTWSVVTTPTIAGASALSGVSCTGPKRCTAVGAQTDQQSLTLVEAWNGTAWKVAPSPNPSPIAGTGGNQLRSVTCVDTHDCTAVGGYVPDAAQSGTLLTLVESWDGAHWSVATSANDPHALVNLPTGVSCSDPTHCVAVGAALNHNRSPRTLALGNG